VTLTMAVFGIGAALPLILLGLLSRATLMGVRSRLMSAGKLGKGLLGAAFIVIGAAIVSGADKRIEAALVAASPPWLTELTTSF
jgi:cytochrome c-type biogenesis protein